MLTKNCITTLVKIGFRTSEIIRVSFRKQTEDSDAWRYNTISRYSAKILIFHCRLEEEHILTSWSHLVLITTALFFVVWRLISNSDYYGRASCQVNCEYSKVFLLHTIGPVSICVFQATKIRLRTERSKLFLTKFHTRMQLTKNSQNFILFIFCQVEVNMTVYTSVTPLIYKPKLKFFISACRTS